MEAKRSHHPYVGFLGKHEMVFNEKIDDVDTNAVELYRLADFRFVYASPHAKKLPRAVAMFDRFMRSHERVDLSELIRYFRVQWSWDNQKWSELTREDRTGFGQE